MTWQESQLKYVTRFSYGDSLPSDDEERQGPIKVYGSNGPYAEFSRANTQAPVIVVGRKGSYGKINWSDKPVFASDTTFFVDASATSHHLRWIYYLLHTLKLDVGSNEAAVPGLNRESAYSRTVLVPPIYEQQSIAGFLDHETSKIDSLIVHLDDLLKLVAEKREATISHTVTRGINPDVTLVDSGIEWIGEIPEHWRIVQIKRLCQLGNGSTPLRENKSYWDGGEFPWLTSTVVNEDIIGAPEQFVTELALQECHLPKVRPNSVLVAITGQGKTRGMSGILRYESTINQHLAFISPKLDQLDPRFLQLYMSGSYKVLRMISEGIGSTRGALTVEQLGEFPLVLPPFYEQNMIVQKVDQITLQLDELISQVKNSVELLQERRSALIEAAVTGKIRVTE